MKILGWLLIAYIGCVQAKTREPIPAIKPDPITITIWVHGSLIAPDFIFHDFFYRKVGMVNAQQYHPRYNSRNIAETLCKHYPSSYTMKHFYFWGWSGKLSRRARKKSARPLYLALLELIEHYKEKYPKIPLRLRLITHSHGGNVLLNLCHVQDEDTPLAIDELIMLSCPVQFETKDNIKTDCFKKIYSFYTADLYQVIDFQRTIKNGRHLKMHSERRFAEIPHLRQAKIKINGWAIMHVDFMKKKFLRHLPRLCQELDDFYDALTPEQQKREKLLHLRVDRHSVNIRRKLF